MEANNNAKLRKAAKCAFEALKLISVHHDKLPNDVCAKAGLAVFDLNEAFTSPARECDRFDDDLQADALHEAFVKHCNDCDCPMGCIHRMEMKGLLDVRCASILKCFARFALSEATPKEGGAE